MRTRRCSTPPLAFLPCLSAASTSAAWGVASTSMVRHACTAPAATGGAAAAGPPPGRAACAHALGILPYILAACIGMHPAYLCAYICIGMHTYICIPIYMHTYIYAYIYIGMPRITCHCTSWDWLAAPLPACLPVWHICARRRYDQLPLRAAAA